MSDKVSYIRMTTFRWFYGVLIIVLIAIFGVIGVSISAVDGGVEDNEDIINQINVSVGKIQTSIENIEEDIDKL